MEKYAVVITGVGSGGANNLIKSIRASRYNETKIIGTDANKYLVNKSEADENYIVPLGTEERYIEALNTIIERHDAKTVIAQNEAEIRTISERRDELHCSVMLPDHETVTLCLDKFRLNKRLEEIGFPVPKTLSLDEITIEEAFELIAPDGQPLWCRSRYGSSSFEAQPMYSVRQAEQWISDWTERGGFERSEFTLSEFLPGRDFHILTLWNNGELLIGKGNERNEYFFGENTGVATPLVGRQIYDEDLNRRCTEMTKALAPSATGNFGFDFRVSVDGTPKLTEINIGKFSMVNYFFNLSGEYNMAEFFLDIVFGSEDLIPDLEDPYGDVDTDLFLARGIDMEPDIFSLEEIESVPNFRE